MKKKKIINKIFRLDITQRKTKRYSSFYPFITCNFCLLVRKSRNLTSRWHLYSIDHRADCERVSRVVMVCDYPRWYEGSDRERVQHKIDELWPSTYPTWCTSFSFYAIQLDPSVQYHSLSSSFLPRNKRMLRVLPYTSQWSRYTLSFSLLPSKSRFIRLNEISSARLFLTLRLLAVPVHQRSTTANWSRAIQWQNGDREKEFSTGETVACKILSTC